MADGQIAEVASPIEGTVVQVELGVGNRVDPGTAVMTVEADAMRVAVQAGVTGRIQEVCVQVGDAVVPGDVLVVVRLGPSEPVDSDVDTRPSPATSCLNCGASGLEPGFIEDRGQGSSGYGRWVQGRLEVGLFGARRMGRQRRVIEAYRCPECSHLALFATDDG